LVRIFLVDDSAIIRSHLRATLEMPSEWVVVGEADDGRRAVETWPQYRPTLTIMDFRMPEMDGLEAARRLSKSHPDSPILMVTVDPSPQLEREAKKAGIKGLCSKSDVRSLLEAVETLVKGKTYFHPALAAT
jgi:DNA-binding NarL/FixJ family response regulator